MPDLLTFKDIIMYSPYETYTRHNLITTKAFKNDIFLETKEFSTLKENLINSLFSNNGHCFYYLTGFSGTGKTTFVKWLRDDIRDNIKAATGYLNFSFVTTSEANYFEVFLKTNIKSRIEDFEDTFSYIFTNKIYFIRNNIFGELNDTNFNVVADFKENPIESPTFGDIWDKFFGSLSIKSLLFILLLEKALKTKKEIVAYPNEQISPSIIFVDNLDALNLNYLVSGFWDDFFKAYMQLVKLCNDLDWNFELKHHLKVLFTLREPNYNLARANINSHISDVLGWVNKGKFKLIQNDLKGILEKRCNFATKSSIVTNKDSILDFISVISSEDEIYREKVYLPLFNYDIRKICQKIVQITEADSYSVFDKKVYDVLFANPEFRNGARGNILHYFIKIFFEGDNKYPIDPIFDETNPDNSPYCSYCRLLLTLIYNHTYGTTKLAKDLSDLDPLLINSFPLTALIRSLRIYEKEPLKSLIPYNNIFEWLSNFYDLRNETLTHLVSLRNKNINTNNDFTFEEEIELCSKTYSNQLNSSKLNEIKVNINPSGIIYLRYLIPHFEFMSACKYWNDEKFTKNFKSLYVSIGLNQNDSLYEFEPLLTDVLKMVKNKKTRNESFLKSMFHETTIKNIESYQNKNLIVHFRDGADSLYSSRMITTHLNYINSFRRYLISNEFFKNNVENNQKSLPDSKSLKQINDFILDIEQKYLDLYFKNESREIQVFDKSILNFMNKYKTYINEEKNIFPTSKTFDYEDR